MSVRNNNVASRQWKMCRRCNSNSFISRFRLPTVGEIVAGLGCSFLSIMSIYSQLKETKKDVISSLPKAIEQSMITESFARDHIHVQRKDVETKISLALCDIEKYYIVYGPKGAGKSEIVHHVALEKEAVIKVDVTSAQTKEDIIKILCRKLVGSDMTAVDLDDLVKAIKISKRMPTIIFDVERGD
jgi:hypothetical protein